MRIHRLPLSISLHVSSLPYTFNAVEGLSKVAFSVALLLRYTSSVRGALMSNRFVFLGVSREQDAGALAGFQPKP